MSDTEKTVAEVVEFLDQAAQWGLDVFGPERDVGIDKAIAFIKSQQAELARLKDAVRSLRGDSPDVDPETHIGCGLFCGLEDRAIHDRYEAAAYGYTEGAEAVYEWLNNILADLPEGGDNYSDKLLAKIALRKMRTRRGGA